MGKTCFVMMPMGDQSYDNVQLTEDGLRKLYDDLIKEAINRARPDLDVVRSDDIARPGEITPDIYEHIYDADYVIADISYPNPNVFYELGLRHASKTGTILVRDQNTPPPPFDLHGQRHIEYENTATGLKALAKKLRKTFDAIDEKPGRPDNPFLNKTEPRYALPTGGETYQVLQIGKDGKPVWDWLRSHG